MIVVGIDYDSYKATLVALPLEGSIARVRTSVVTFRKASQSGEAAALVALASVRAGILHELTEGGGVCDFTLGAELDDIRPDVVWIERGFGMSRRADFILGAYFGAIYSATAGECPTNAMEAREWKRTVTAVSGIGRTVKGAGNPNAKKEIANEACRALLELAEVDGSDWTPDALDAFGVAYTARKLNREALAASDVRLS